VGLEGMTLDHHRHVTVQALQPLLIEALEDAVAKVGDLHL
jgi:hypothetical protein